MVTAIYQRASDDKQDYDDAVSIEMQNDTINKFCDYKDFANKKYYTEIKSARTLKGRLELDKLLKDVKKGRIKRIVIYKLDRLTRNLRDLMNILHLLEKHDVELHSTYENIDTKSPSGRMLVQVLGIVAEWESANTSKRVKDAMMLRTRQGRWLSVAPYGFDLIDGNLSINEVESELLQIAFSKVLEEGYSLAAAERYINDNYGTNWKPDFLTRKIDQESTVGNTYRNGEVIYDTHDGIISTETRDKLRAIRDSRASLSRNRGHHNDIFRRKIKCYNCTNFLTLSANKRRDGTYNYSYTCSQCFKRHRLAVNVAETVMEETLLNYMTNVELDGFSSEDKEIPDSQKKRSELRKELGRLKKKRERIQRAWINEMIPDEDLERYQKEIDTEESKVREELDSIVDEGSITDEELKELRVVFSEAYRGLTRNEKIRFIQTHFRELHFEREKVPGMQRKYNVTLTKIIFM